MRRQPREREQQHHWSQLVSDYIDGELTPVESLGVARHLWECHECRVLLRDFRAIVAALQDVRRVSRIRRGETGVALTFSDISNRRRGLRFRQLAPRLES